MALRKSAKEQIGVDLPSEDDDQTEAEFHEPSRTTAEEQQAAQQALEAEQSDRPEWLPEQYKSPEDLASAHRSLQERFRQEAESRKGLEARVDELTELVQQSQQPAYEPTDVLDSVAAEIQAAREVGDVRRELELQTWLQNYTWQQTASAQAADQAAANEPALAAQDELIAAHHAMQMERQYPDFAEYAPRIRELIQEEPWRLPDQALNNFTETQRALSGAYEVLKARDVLAEQDQMRERGLSQADISRARKLEAQTMEGASGRPDEPSQVDRELAEMQAALRRNSGIAAIKQEMRRR